MGGRRRADCHVLLIHSRLRERAKPGVISAACAGRGRGQRIQGEVQPQLDVCVSPVATLPSHQCERLHHLRRPHDAATAAGGVTHYYWTDQVLHDPSVVVRVYKEGSRHSCSKTVAVLTEAVLQESWDGYACSFNPSIGVSAPWAISFAAWPDCGERTQAIYTSPTLGRGKVYHEYNSRSSESFEDFSGFGYSPPAGPCYGVYPTIQAVVGTSVDSFGAGNLNHALQICLKFQTKK